MLLREEGPAEDSFNDIAPGIKVAEGEAWPDPVEHERVQRIPAIDVAHAVVLI